MWNATVEYKGEGRQDATRRGVAPHPREVQGRGPQSVHLESKEPPHGLTLEIESRRDRSRLGLSKEDALILWNRGFTGHDHQMWRVWEDLYGASGA